MKSARLVVAGLIAMSLITNPVHASTKPTQSRSAATKDPKAAVKTKVLPKAGPAS